MVRLASNTLKPLSFALQALPNAFYLYPIQFLFAF
jgi:hypothetical protein